MADVQIEIEIDGKHITADMDQTIIQVADKEGIYIPRFCYHKHLSIAANCRMCLVEVEKSPKTLPACATPITPGMKVFTRSQKSLEAQRAVMEFLLINHPLDCPICDQGGECELQDLSMGYGAAQSRYNEAKRSIKDENLGPLIATDMTRCIYCTRCVRFGDEMAGVRELGVTNRGENVEISTFVHHAITSEVSGNIIDLCPVGALTSKPFRFRARAWELEQFPSISPHDCMGSNLNVHTRYGEVKRVVSRENNDINETWLSDRDRFSYVGLYHPDRYEEPIVKSEGKWQVVEWQHALDRVASELRVFVDEHGADKLGALASPNSTIEEFYLLQKIVRGLGSPHIDHRLREVDTKDQAEVGSFPGMSMPIAEIDHCDAILLIGSNIQKELPLASLRMRKASKKGAAVLVVNPMDYDFNFDVRAKKIATPHRLTSELASLLNSLENNEPHVIADALKGKRKVAIILGALALHHPQASELRYLAQEIAKKTDGKLNILTDGANSAGGWLAGAVPHRLPGGDAINHAGLSANAMLEKPRQAYILLNVEPDLDCANAALAIEAMKQGKFIVALSMYRNPILEAYAHVILPIAPFTETSGTFINAEGAWQSFKGVAKPFAQSRPTWKVLRVLGNFLKFQGFDYESSEEVKHEVHDLIAKAPALKMNFTKPAKLSTHDDKNALSRIGEIPIYALDSLVRRSQPLQDTQTIMEGNVNAVRINWDTAKKLNLSEDKMAKIKQGHGIAELPVIFDARVPEGAVWIAGAVPATSMLGELFGEVEIGA